ncbi:zinc-ribbon domain-containing protein [Tautonia plasticadhaerens]|nr:zinc-ribbon domain-containing protein [Tautonia plasticadhaerens]
MSIVPRRTLPLSITHPQLVAEWHPERNGDLTPEHLTAGSNRKVWWRCLRDPAHEWEAQVNNRTHGGQQCPHCANRRVSEANSLATLYPEVAAQWHPTANGDLRPEAIIAGSNTVVTWACPAGPDHVWRTRVVERTTGGKGCPFCAGRRASVTNSLASLFPALAAEWHPERNGDLTPDGVVAGSHRKAWWRCSKDPEHVWQATVVDRTTRGIGCPNCGGRVATATNSLAGQFPAVAAEWHPTRNGGLTPDRVLPRAGTKVWWTCPEGPDHEWEATVANRTSGRTGCPCCAGRHASVTNSLATLHPDLAAQWHPEKNGDLTPDRVVAGSNTPAWWTCPEGPDHEWRASPANRTKLGRGCPCCAGQRASADNSLATRYPEVAHGWHPTRNGDLTPDRVAAGSTRRAWWRCSKDPSHEWEAMIYTRTLGDSGCPTCKKGWTVGAIRGLVASLVEHLSAFTPAELYLLFQQNGLIGSTGKGKAFADALATGRFPADELGKFVRSEPSLVDEFLADPTRSLGDGEPEDEDGEARALAVLPEGSIDGTDGPAATSEAEGLPTIETSRVLAALDHAVVSSADAEAVEFLVASGVAKLWAHAFLDEDEAVAQAEDFHGGAFAERVKGRFLDEHRRARNLAIPEGYAFALDGRPVAPNLMQRLVAVQVRDDRRVGNWSGTGAGKTLSAVLASRAAGCRTTVVCCPNAVVEGWRDVIIAAFPGSLVAIKTFEPGWPAGDQGRPRYLVLNYEMLQQPDSAARVGDLIGRGPIDLVIIDEVHFAKQRAAEDMTLRRRNLFALMSLAAEDNPGLRVLGMSATPVINNLQEGRSLVELVTGAEHAELETRATLPNCMRLHQRLTTLGIRWMPRCDAVYQQVEVPVDCSAYLDEIRALGRKNGNPLSLEQVLTRARMPVIRAQVRPKTLIYTHYVQGIDRLLYDALAADGWRVGFYTGDDKSGLEGFVSGDVDVLIGSAAIGVGVDGLQRVCNRLIVAVLPWTGADFEQLKGRVFRQGQRQGSVTMVLPITYAEVGGQRWSWCESRLNRLRFKKSLADAAVDGVVPEEPLRTPAQAYQDVMGWLDRLDSGQVEAITRTPIRVPLPPTDETGVRRRRHGDFTKMNQVWGRMASDALHRRLQADPGEWAHYHAMYRAAREDWAIVPAEELIRWCRRRSGYVIGDFGCGEAMLANALSDLHVVHSFDHVAIDDSVVACDMAHVPLEDESLDLAVFSLSLMGADPTGYLREAHRTLKLDGELHVVEPTSRFTDRDRFTRDLTRLGFDVVRVEDWWKFTHIRALKTDGTPQDGAAITF